MSAAEFNWRHVRAVERLVEAARRACARAALLRQIEQGPTVDLPRDVIIRIIEAAEVMS